MKTKLFKNIVYLFLRKKLHKPNITNADLKIGIYYEK